MKSVITKPYAEGIDDDGKEIMRLHYMANKCAHNAIDYAIKAGQRLIKKKASPEIQHGDWTPYVESLGISKQTSAGYMRLAKSKVQGLVLLGIEEALKALATPKEKKQPADLFTPQHEDPAPVTTPTPLTDHEKTIIAESDARIGKMIADFAKERRDAEQRASENKWHDEHDPRGKAISLGLEILATLRELTREIERKNVTPIIESVHLNMINDYILTITNSIRNHNDKQRN